MTGVNPRMRNESTIPKRSPVVFEQISKGLNIKKQLTSYKLIALANARIVNSCKKNLIEPDQYSFSESHYIN